MLLTLDENMSNANCFELSMIILDWRISDFTRQSFCVIFKFLYKQMTTVKTTTMDSLQYIQ